MSGRAHGDSSMEPQRSAAGGSLAGVVGGAICAMGGVGQRAASALAAAFFLASNFVSQDASTANVLMLGCGGVCAFLGYGLAAVVLHLSGSSAEVFDSFEDHLRLPFFFSFVMLFHVAEFIFVVRFHPSDLSFRSLMLAPVPAGGYSVAMIVALVEHWSLHALFGRLVPRALGATIFWLGSLLCVSGWALRVAALFTAKSNFTHIVAFRKEASHALVTSGVYQLCRHPSYLGWFVWSVSSQLVLGNVLSFFAYFFVSWKFFAGRIPSEEAALVHFFGAQYIDYARRVPCGLPFMSKLDV